MQHCRRPVTRRVHGGSRQPTFGAMAGGSGGNGAAAPRAHGARHGQAADGICGGALPLRPFPADLETSPGIAMKSPAASNLRFVLFATGVAAIGGFLFGYDTAVINGANSYLKAHMNLNSSQEGMAGASAIAGCIPGAMFAGFLSDRFGRRKMLFLCALLYAVSGLLSAIPNTLGQFLTARFISGLGIGASSMICPVYIAEISPEKWRGRLGTLFQLGIVTGIFLTLFVNKVIQGLGNEAWNTAFGWRWMLGMEVVPAVLFIALLCAVPESPRWLAQKGRESEARVVLEKALGPEQARLELAAIGGAASR